MEENVKEIAEQGDGNKHTSGRVLMASAVAAGAIGGALATGGDVSAQTEYMDRQANMSPKTEVIAGVGVDKPVFEKVSEENIYSLGNVNTGFVDVESVNESKEGEFDGKIIPPEDPNYLDKLREAIKSEGKILIESDPLPWEVVGPLGANDKHGNYYENAINKIMIAGNEIEIITGGYFDEMTFLFASGNNKVGEMLSIYWLQDEDSGKSFDASPYLEALGGGNKIYINPEDSGFADYGIITAIGTSGSRSILPPEVYLDSEGNARLVGSSPDGSNVTPSGFVGSDGAWIHSVLFKGFIQPDGRQVIELLGVINGSEVSILPEKLDSRSLDLAGYNK